MAIYDSPNCSSTSSSIASMPMDVARMPHDVLRQQDGAGGIATIYISINPLRSALISNNSEKLPINLSPRALGNHDPSISVSRSPSISTGSRSQSNGEL